MSYTSLGYMTVEAQSARIARERENQPPPAPPPPAPAPTGFLTLPKLTTFPVVFKLPTATPAPTPAPAPVVNPNAWNVYVQPYNPKPDQPGDISYGSCDKGIFRSQWLNEYWVKNGKNCGTVAQTYWRWVKTHPGWVVPPLAAAAYKKSGMNPSIFGSTSTEESTAFPLAMYLAGVRSGTIPPPQGFPMTLLPPQVQAPVPVGPPPAPPTVSDVVVPTVTKGMVVTTLVGAGLGLLLTRNLGWTVAGAAAGAGAGYAMKGVMPF